MWLALLVFSLIAFFYSVFLVANKHEEKIEKVVDNAVDSAYVVETKDDGANFDTIIDNTRVVIKTNRPIKIKVQ